MSIGGVSGSTPDFSSMRANMEAKMAERFASDDADGSGGLSLSEFTESHKNGPPGGGPGGPGGPRGAGGPGGAANVAGSKPSAEELFAGLDSDSDGEITQEEFAAAKPPAPYGDFASDTMSSLLSAQEDSSSSAILNLLKESADEAEETSESSADDLLSALLESLEEDA